MARQLVLLDASPADLRLDDATRLTGRRGVAAARAALAALTAASSGPRQGDDSRLPAA